MRVMGVILIGLGAAAAGAAGGYYLAARVAQQRLEGALAAAKAGAGDALGEFASLFDGGGSPANASPSEGDANMSASSPVRQSAPAWYRSLGDE